MEAPTTSAVISYAYWTNYNTVSSSISTNNFDSSAGITRHDLSQLALVDALNTAYSARFELRNLIWVCGCWKINKRG